MFELQRYDATWGGWRPVRLNDETEDPAQFDTKPEAVAAQKHIQSRSAYKYRVLDRSTGRPV